MMLPALRVHDDWLLLPQRLALHEPTATAVIADVHLGYSAVRRRLGDAVPLPGVNTVLAPLVRAAANHRIERLVVAGDLFERGVDDGLYQEFCDILGRLGVRFAGLAPGNHDRIDPQASPVLLWPTDAKLGGWHVHHGDGPTTDDRTIGGHWHPSAMVGRRKCPCFLVGPRRIILPAFSADAAGVSARGAAWSQGCRPIAVVDAGLVDLTAGGQRGRVLRRR